MKHNYILTSFADPADIEAYRLARERGATEQEALAVGDNGVGQWGANTAQEDVPMAALHADDLIARWGSVDAAAHKRIRVTRRGATVECLIEDRCGVRGRVDLNPAALLRLELRPPVWCHADWDWAPGQD